VVQEFHQASLAVQSLALVVEVVQDFHQPFGLRVQDKLEVGLLFVLELEIQRLLTLAPVVVVQVVMVMVALEVLVSLFCATQQITRSRLAQVLLDQQQQ
jgi:hypothetical protein